MTSKAWKEVYSLSVLARMHNPFEYHQLYKAHQFDTDAQRHLLLYNVPQYLWGEKKHYKAFKFKYPQYMLMDLFHAPFVFVGTLTSVDSLCRSSVFAGTVMKIELSDVRSVHKYYDENLTDKKLIFLSPGFYAGNVPSWIIDPEKDLGDDWPTDSWQKFGLDIEAPGHDFVIGKRYIVFLKGKNNKFVCTQETGYDLLPSLYTTALRNTCFPVEGTRVVDVNRYFGKGESIEFGELESVLNSVFDEIVSWARTEH